LSGELDLLDITEKNNSKILDFKCSNDDFKLEWIIQLLLYYCLYSEKEKRFLADRFVVGTCPICGFEEATGDECENCGSALSPLQLINPKSKLTGDTPVIKETVSYYFPLKEYQAKLEAWLDSKTRQPNGQCRFPVAVLWCGAY
jgi:methionyl-tRNA synthetase